MQIVGKMRTIAAVLGLILTTEGLMTAEYGGVVKLAGLSLRTSDAVPFRAVFAREMGWGVKRYGSITSIQSVSWASLKQVGFGPDGIFQGT